MKPVYFIILSCLFLFSCTQEKTNTTDLSGSLVFDPFPLEVPEENSLMARWEQKPVMNRKLIDDFEEAGNWHVEGIGEMSYTTERSYDGSQSLRFRTSLRDEAHYRENRSEWDSFNGRQGGTTFVRLDFEQPQDWREYNRISFQVYVHPTEMPTYCIFLRMVCQDAVNTATDYNGASHFVQDLKPGEWNHVMFEIPHLQRDKVTSFFIYQMLRGHNPEEEGIVTYDIDQLEIQQVETDQYEGWEVENGKFAYNHVGYQPQQVKIAYAGLDGGDVFELLNAQDKVVFTNTVEHLNNRQGIFRVLDFTDFQEEGMYKLSYGGQTSNIFAIDREVWVQPLFKTINFFFCQRCGYHVPGVHLECHKDWQGFYGDIKKVINGGWHDAGDLSQGSWRTAMSALAMMMHMERLEAEGGYDELVQRIREELAWGMDWLLKTRFGDGYHMSFSVMRIYTDNEIGTIDDVVTPARNVPWENFLAAVVQSKASQMLQDTYPDLASRSEAAAKEDWQAAFDSREVWDEADYREAAWGATASLSMAELTGDEKYLGHAVMFGNLLVECQEQAFVSGIPITGYFHTSSSREEVIHNRHAAFEEAPLVALAMLCKKLPDHADWMKWYSAAVLHSEYFMKRGSEIARPFDLLPNSVWHKSEIETIEEEALKTDMMRQFMDGTALGNDYMLRTFPIYSDDLFHGNTNIHMSSTWALAEASRLRKDSEGMQLVGKQFQWLFGANPFSQSLMYGVGYDFPPHFAYCLKDLVGALPVGMDCMSGDDPHWSATNTATYKEIWVEPVNRFMGALSVYLGEQDLAAAGRPDADAQLVEAGLNPEAGDPGKVKLILAGEAGWEFSIRTFNLGADVPTENQVFQLDSEGKGEFVLEIVDSGKPYIAVIAAADNPLDFVELTGAGVDMAF